MTHKFDTEMPLPLYSNYAVLTGSEDEVMVRFCIHHCGNDE